MLKTRFLPCGYVAAGSVREALQQEITHLAQTQEGPNFEPHVTVVVFDAENESAAMRVAHDIASELKVRASRPTVAELLAADHMQPAKYIHPPN